MKLYQRGTPRRGMEHIAQGNALGTNDKRNFRPERAKELILNAFDLVLSCRDSAKQTSLLALAAPRFALSGCENGRSLVYPGRCPGLVACCPFRALIAV
jgi:hypothetical protein